jgi:hypothetical protein
MLSCFLILSFRIYLEKLLSGTFLFLFYLGHLLSGMLAFPFYPGQLLVS